MRSVHFNLLLIIMPKKLVLLTLAITLFLIEIFPILDLILLYEKPCNVFYQYLVSVCLLVYIATYQDYSVQY